MTIKGSKNDYKKATKDDTKSKVREKAIKVRHLKLKTAIKNDHKRT